MRVAVAACLATVLSLALPPGPAHNLSYLVIAMGSVAAIWVGTRRHRPSRPAAWYLVAAGMTSWVAGNAVLAMAGPTGAARTVGLVLYGGMYPLACWAC